MTQSGHRRRDFSAAQHVPRAAIPFDQLLDYLVGDRKQLVWSRSAALFAPSVRRFNEKLASIDS
jgi:hypothetical protein